MLIKAKDAKGAAVYFNPDKIVLIAVPFILTASSHEPTHIFCEGVQFDVQWEEGERIIALLHKEEVVQ